MASSDSQINKPQHGHPKRTELADVNINTHVQSINTEEASLNLNFKNEIGSQTILGAVILSVFLK